MNLFVELPWYTGSVNNNNIKKYINLFSAKGPQNFKKNVNKLDGVGPLDNKPYTEKLHKFVQKKNKKIKM